MDPSVGSKMTVLLGANGWPLAPDESAHDLGDSEFRLIDHTPGYGSVARYWQHAVQNANEENCGSCPADPVLVLQAMGRKIGFIPAAARLADPAREMPLQIYLAESPCTLEQLAEQVNEQLRSAGRFIEVISEGFDVDGLGDVKDAFGHAPFGSSRLSRRKRFGPESLRRDSAGRRRGGGQAEPDPVDRHVRACRPLGGLLPPILTIWATRPIAGPWRRQ